MASYNLEDGAQLWYIQVQTDEGTPTWRRFKELINLRYGPPLRSAPLFELADCHRTSTVAEYQDRFQVLLPRAGYLDEAQSPAVHWRAPSTSQPRRAYPQSAVASGSHEPGAPIGAPGAVLTGACQSDVPGPFATSPGAPGHAGSSN
jgi:hypothetical protein